MIVVISFTQANFLFTRLPHLLLTFIFYFYFLHLYLTHCSLGHDSPFSHLFPLWQLSSTVGFRYGTNACKANASKNTAPMHANANAKKMAPLHAKHIIDDFASLWLLKIYLYLMWYRIHFIIISCVLYQFQVVPVCVLIYSNPLSYFVKCVTTWESSNN